MYRNDNCMFLRQQRDYEGREVKRYGLLIYLVSIIAVAAIIFLICAAVIAKDKNGVIISAGAVGTILAGSAMGFVIKQKNAHAGQL
jgi:lipopolysaccharide/colanic/teichoic acid biosynthesis glycosyltransferase